MRPAHAIAILYLAFVSGCTRTEIVEIPKPPPPRENSVVIGGKEREIELLCYEFKDIEYLNKTEEELVALRVMVDGASITADLPTRLLGNTIDLASRNISPAVGHPYHTFYLSARGNEGFYCRMRSWVIDPDDNDPEKNDRSDDYAGWFSINRGEQPGEWIFE